MRKIHMQLAEATRQEVLKNPEKSYTFSIMRPGGNDTALVLGVIRDQTKRKDINDALQRIYKNVEQVGFVNLDPKAPELLMAGGEFCGNATRSTAWLALGGKPGEVQILVSGVNDRLKAGVLPNGDAFAQMPIYPDISKVIKDGDNSIVEMEGITQYINFDTGEIEGLSENALKQKAMSIIKKKNLDRYPAAGVIWSTRETNGWRITPVVYVKGAGELGTLYAETACGSGTAALGLVLALEKGGSIRDIPIVQPTAVPIKVSVEFDGKTFGYTQISGPVEKLTEAILVDIENAPYVIDRITDPKDLEAVLTNGNLIPLYKNTFCKAPYFESFTNSEVREIFTEYMRDGLLFLAKSDKGEIVGFGAALPMKNVPATAKVLNIEGQDANRSWYMADLGVRDDMRNRGIARNLVKARLDRLRGAFVVMRTSVNNIASQSLYRSLGFQLIPGAREIVEGARIDANIPTRDERIFMSKQL